MVVEIGIDPAMVVAEWKRWMLLWWVSNSDAVVKSPGSLANIGGFQPN